jgi:hypothetical protein
MFPLFSPIYALWDREIHVDYQKNNTPTDTQNHPRRPQIHPIPTNVRSDFVDKSQFTDVFLFYAIYKLWDLDIEIVHQLSPTQKPGII